MGVPRKSSSHWGFPMVFLWSSCGLGYPRLKRLIRERGKHKKSAAVVETDGDLEGSRVQNDAPGDTLRIVGRL